MDRLRRLPLFAFVLWCGVTALAPGVGAQGRFRADASVVVINEILASNREAVEDPQGDYDDWIELYNPGRTAVDVGGMYLTDDATLPTKWQIPTGQADATTIEPAGYLVVWAEDDITASGLHAGFKLDADGEELHLVAADGMTVIDSIEFGTQVVDVSYGRYPDGDPNLRHMAEPTPGAANSEVYDGIAAEPQFSVQGCLCRETVTLTLSTETPDARIYYTLDGREPFGTDRERPGGFTYAGPIQVRFTTTVKAVAWRPGWRHSRIHTERYTFIDSDLQHFSSPLPIAVVDTLAGNVANSQVPAYSYFIDTGRGGRASVTGATDFAGWAGINVRGKSSEGFAKKQYHFEIWDEDNRDKAVSILGFPADADWVLQGPYSDKSLMRNVLAYQWSRELGRYAPRTRFIELFLNTGGTSVSMDDYVGVYVFMEKIKIAPGRVDIAELGPSDNAEPEITGGYIVKKDKYDGGEATFTTSTGLNLIHEDPEGADLTQQQRNWIRDYVNAFEAALYGGNFTDSTEGYAAFIDVGSFIDHHIVVELCKNIDGFRLSTYMSKARNGKLSMGPVWDYNLSLGNADYLSGWIPTGWYFDQLGNNDYPWWRRLFEDPEFRLAYADRWFAVRRDLFATERLLGIVDDYAALLDEPQQRNFDRWRVLGRYIWPNWYIAQTYQEEIDWMKDWLADRLTWMDGQIARDMAPGPTGVQSTGRSRRVGPTSGHGQFLRTDLLFAGWFGSALDRPGYRGDAQHRPGRGDRTQACPGTDRSRR
ncbi:MAG: CotH kinase family protein [Phycisphaerales bacterium]|nr:MAG: CotH kinase family protein [Phycisphaerales bacterium]